MIGVRITNIFDSILASKDSTVENKFIDYFYHHPDTSKIVKGKIVAKETAAYMEYKLSEQINTD